MADTTRLGMPLLQPSQAQKHVTVNEALARLDALVDLVLRSTGKNAPPSTVVEGDCWFLPADATGPWDGHGGEIAIAINGGWAFQSPAFGQRAYIADLGVQAIFNGSAWARGAITLGMTGGGMLAGLAEGEVSVSGGASVTSDVVIPAGAMVIGATARVSDALTGTVTGWKLGTEGAENRFGQGLGTALGSWARGILGQPMTYWQDEPLILTAEGGSFEAGRVRLAVHWLALRIPD